MSLLLAIFVRSVPSIASLKMHCVFTRDDTTMNKWLNMFIFSLFSQMGWKRQSSCTSFAVLILTLSVQNVASPLTAPQWCMFTWKPNTYRPLVLSVLSAWNIALLETLWTSTDIATTVLFNKTKLDNFLCRSGRCYQQYGGWAARWDFPVPQMWFSF